MDALEIMLHRCHSMKKNGFSIIELLFVSMLVTVVFTGISLSVLVSLKAQNVSRERKIATELATLVMKDIEAEATEQAGTFWDSTEQLVISPNTSYSGYDLTATKNISDCEINGRKCAKVLVTVNWQNVGTESAPNYKYSYVLEKKMVKL